MEVQNGILIKANKEDIVNGTLFIPDEIQIIGKESCANLTTLNKISGGNNVRRIEYMAFSESGLKEIPKFVKSFPVFLRQNLSEDIQAIMGFRNDLGTAGDFTDEICIDQFSFCNCYGLLIDNIRQNIIDEFPNIKECVALFSRNISNNGHGMDIVYFNENISVTEKSGGFFIKPPNDNDSEPVFVFQEDYSKSIRVSGSDPKFYSRKDTELNEAIIEICKILDRYGVMPFEKAFTLFDDIKLLILSDEDWVYDQEYGQEGFRALHVGSGANMLHRIVEALLCKLILNENSQYGIGYSLKKTIVLKAPDFLPTWTSKFTLHQVGADLNDAIIEYLSDKILGRQHIRNQNDHNELMILSDNSLNNIVAKLDELVGTKTLILGIIEGAEVIANAFEKKKSRFSTDTGISLLIPSNDEITMTSSQDFNKILLITSLFGEATCGLMSFVEDNAGKIGSGIKKLECQIIDSIDAIIGNPVNEIDEVKKTQ